MGKRSEILHRRCHGRIGAAVIFSRHQSFPLASCRLCINSRSSVRTPPSAAVSRRPAADGSFSTTASAAPLAKLTHSSYKLLKMNKHAVQRGQYYASGAGDSRHFWESQTATWLAVRRGEEILKADSETTTPLGVFTTQLVVEASRLRCQSVM